MAGSQTGAHLWVSEYITPHDIYLHGVERVLAAVETRWQSMQIVRSGAGGTGLVLDGKWQSGTGDEFLYHEPLVQPACVALADAGRPPVNALILGGGEGATLREVLRWRTVERAVMVDLDGEVVEACKAHLGEMHRGCFDDPRAEVVIDDALKYVADPAAAPAGERPGWDLIISDLSDPIEDGPSFELFTREYFEQLRDVLASGGVLVVQAGPVSPWEMHLHARLVRTLCEVFPETRSLTSAVPAYAAPWSFILASREPIAVPDPARTDALLSEHTGESYGPLRMFDGTALVGLAHPPKHLRDAIEAETTVYTKAAPPAFFGKGKLG